MSSQHSPILVVMAALAGHTDDAHYEAGTLREAGSTAATARTSTEGPDACRA